MKKIFILLFLLFTTNVYASSQLLHTVCSSGCDYTTLDGAVDHLATSHANLVTSDVYADIEITEAFADTAAVNKFCQKIEN